MLPCQERQLNKREEVLDIREGIVTDAQHILSLQEAELKRQKQALQVRNLAKSHEVLTLEAHCISVRVGKEEVSPSIR